MPTNAEYAKINIACKELGLDKHQLLSDRYGVESSKDLTRANLSDLFLHFKRLGWTVKRAAAGKSSPRYSDGKHRKILAMWITLHQKKVVRNGADRALQAYVKRLTGIDNLKWCDGEQCRVLIESLKDWGKRYGIEY